MTWTQAKDKAAVEIEHKNFDRFFMSATKEDLYGLMNRAAKLYARSKWDEACGAQKLSCMHQVNSRATVHKIKNALKPEFKP